MFYKRAYDIGQAESSQASSSIDDSTELFFFDADTFDDNTATAARTTATVNDSAVPAANPAPSGSRLTAENKSNRTAVESTANTDDPAAPNSVNNLSFVPAATTHTSNDAAPAAPNVSNLISAPAMAPEPLAGDPRAQFYSDMTYQGAMIRREFTEQGQQLRSEFNEQGQKLRSEFTEQGQQLRREMQDQFQQQGEQTDQKLQQETRERKAALTDVYSRLSALERAPTKAPRPLSAMVTNQDDQLGDVKQQCLEKWRSCKNCKARYPARCWRPTHQV